MIRTITLLVAFSLISTITGCRERTSEYPERDITAVVVWGAGGGTDICNRVIMSEMAKVLGYNINVINKTGGVAGSLGMMEGYKAPHDGYTLVGLSESCVTAGVQGGWDKRMNVWDYFIVGSSPDVVSVTPGSPYTTLTELIEAAKKNPKGIKAAGGGSGSIHHINLMALEKGTNAQFNFIPYPGSAPAQNAALTGEVTVVVTSVAEQAQLIRGGLLRPLAVLEPDAFTIDTTTIVSGFDAFPELAEYLPISQAIGFAIGKETPDDVKAKLNDAFKQAMASEPVQQFAKDNYYVLSGATGKEAADNFDRLESLFSWTMHELGITKVSPEALGIPKPE